MFLGYICVAASFVFSSVALGLAISGFTHKQTSHPIPIETYDVLFTCPDNILYNVSSTFSGTLVIAGTSTGVPNKQLRHSATIIGGVPYYGFVTTDADGAFSVPVIQKTSLASLSVVIEYPATSLDTQLSGQKGCTVAVNYPFTLTGGLVTTSFQINVDAVFFDATLTDPLGFPVNGHAFAFSFSGPASVMPLTPLNANTDLNGRVILRGRPTATGNGALTATYHAYAIPSGDPSSSINQFTVFTTG